MIFEKIKNSKLGKICGKMGGRWLGCKDKITPCLGKVEENFNFPFSHIAWHVFSVVALLVGIAGVLLFLWGLTPVFKNGVSEPEYLKQRKVQEADVLECARVAPVQQRRYVARRTDDGEIIEEELPPVISLEKLSRALPTLQFTKPSRTPLCDRSEAYYDEGEWVYPERCYLKDEREGAKIRKQLQQKFPFDSLQQQMAADFMASHLMNYQVDSRVSIYRNSVEWLLMDDANETIGMWNAIDSVIGNAVNVARTDEVDRVFGQMFDFIKRNPSSGKPVLLKSLDVVGIAGGFVRLEVFKAVRAGYKTLDMDVEEWSKATDQYLGMTNLHKADMMARTLKCFYDLYEEEARDRLKKNRELKEKYRQDLENAEKDAEQRGKVKKEMRPMGGVMIAVCVAVILVIAILLVLFSMQRTLIRMEKSFNEKK